MEKISKKCPVCGTAFIDGTTNKNKVCCSNKCVTALWYKNNKEHSKQQNKQYRAVNQDKVRKKALVGRPICKDCSKTLNRSNKSGYCVRCRYKHNNWYADNKGHRRKYEEQYRLNPANREKINKRHRDRCHHDLNYHLRSALRCRLKEALKNGQKSGSAVDDLGCSIEFLKSYLESLFLPGMTWDNWGVNGWHIYHILPLSSFDLTDREQFLEACNYRNLQPLWAADNIRKSNHAF